MDAANPLIQKWMQKARWRGSYSINPVDWCCETLEIFNHLHLTVQSNAPMAPSIKAAFLNTFPQRQIYDYDPANPLLKDSGKNKNHRGRAGRFFLPYYVRHPANPSSQSTRPGLPVPLFFIDGPHAPIDPRVFSSHLAQAKKSPCRIRKTPPNRLAHTRNLLPEHRPSTKLQTLAEKTRPRCRPSTALLPRSYRHNHRSLPRRGYADFAQNQCAAGESGDFICLHALPYPL